MGHLIQNQSKNLQLADEHWLNISEKMKHLVTAVWLNAYKVSDKEPSQTETSYCQCHWEPEQSDSLTAAPSSSSSETQKTPDMHGKIYSKT